MSTDNKQPQKPEGAQQIDPAQFAELMVSVKNMGQQLAVLSQRNQELESAAAGGVLPEEEQPVYEIINSPQGFFSADCVFYPEGAQFVDLTGSIIPNETFLPLNRAAERHMTAWLESLPSQTRTPPIDQILEAAMQLRNMEGDRSEFSLAVMHRAIDLATKQGSKISISEPITRPVKLTNVPMMTNSRFNGQDVGRSVSATRYRGEGPAPGDRAEPAMTNGRNELLGRFAPPRVRAG